MVFSLTKFSLYFHEIIYTMSLVNLIHVHNNIKKILLIGAISALFAGCASVPTSNNKDAALNSLNNLKRLLKVRLVYICTVAVVL